MRYEKFEFIVHSFYFKHDWGLKAARKAANQYYCESSLNLPPNVIYKPESKTMRLAHDASMEYDKIMTGEERWNKKK